MPQAVEQSLDAKTGEPEAAGNLDEAEELDATVGVLNEVTQPGTLVDRLEVTDELEVVDGLDEAADSEGDEAVIPFKLSADAPSFEYAQQEDPTTYPDLIAPVVDQNVPVGAGDINFAPPPMQAMLPSYFLGNGGMPPPPMVQPMVPAFGGGYPGMWHPTPSHAPYVYGPPQGPPFDPRFQQGGFQPGGFGP